MQQQMWNSAWKTLVAEKLYIINGQDALKYFLKTKTRLFQTKFMNMIIYSRFSWNLRTEFKVVAPNFHEKIINGKIGQFLT